MSKQIQVSKRLFIFLLATAVLAAFLSLNFVRTVAAGERVTEDSYRSLKSFTDVLALIQKNYVKEVEIDKTVSGAIKGMVQTLDPHSGYLVPEMYKDLQVETKGQFGGLGIEITVKDGLLTVLTPIEDSPAARAGVEAGDKIIKIGEELTKNLSLPEAVKRMRGPRGTSVTISVLREGGTELIPITVVRDVIKVKSVRYRPLDDDFVYVRVSQFQQGSSKEIASALEKMKAEASSGKLSGLVLDLRNNPGGLLTEAIRVSDLFLKEGIIVYTDGRLESQKQKYFSHNDGSEPEFPIVVLVNGGSASAAEIVSGALQDHKRGVVLGTQTFGKGSVQTILPLESGAALRLTTALYYTKSGRSIQQEGISPDIVVEQPKPEQSVKSKEEEKKSRRKEKDLPGSIKDPVAEKDRLVIGSRKAMKSELKNLLASDAQLAEALKILKSWNIFKRSPGSDGAVKEVKLGS